MVGSGHLARGRRTEGAGTAQEEAHCFKITFVLSFLFLSPYPLPSPLSPPTHTSHLRLIFLVKIIITRNKLKLTK